MSKVIAEPAPESTGKKKETIPPADIRLSFPKKGKIQPTGWAGLGMDDEVTVTIKGKIKSLSDNSQEGWSGAGKEVRIDIISCSFAGDRGKAMSMDEAMQEGMKTRKKV